MIPDSLQPVANHLWQSSWFVLAAALLTLALRTNAARIRYYLWLAASLKFLIPFSMLTALTGRLAQRSARGMPPIEWPSAIQQAAVPFAVPAAVRAAPSDFTPLLLTLWIVGFIIVAAIWWRRWRTVRAAVVAGTQIQIGGVHAVSSPSIFEPGVFGICRPVLMLPQGIAERLPAPQLEAIVAHESCHIRRRDNLASALHMAVEAIFWFHPLVWWLGARLLEERERACDEEVVRNGIPPRAYAEGILQVCDWYLEAPVDCVSGVTGSNLKRRIAEIMDARMTRRLSSARKLLLAGAALAATIAPIVTGIVNAPRLRAQSVAETLGKPSGPKFEAASIKLAPPFAEAVEAGAFLGTRIDGAQAHLGEVTIKQLLIRAYGLQLYQLVGPDWLDTQRFEILAKIPQGASKDEVPQMLQWLLAERFGLVAHGETRELPAFALLGGKDGPKMKPAAPAEPAADLASTDGTPGRVTTTRGADSSINGVSAGPFGKTVIKVSNGVLHLEFERMPMADFARMLFPYLARPVVDMTGLKGGYQVTLDFSLADTLAAAKVTAAHDSPVIDDSAGVAAEPSGASVFATIQKLGLRLESRKAPIAVLVVDHVDRNPTDN